MIGPGRLLSGEDIVQYQIPKARYKKMVRDQRNYQELRLALRKLATEWRQLGNETEHAKLCAGLFGCAGAVEELLEGE